MATRHNGLLKPFFNACLMMSEFPPAPLAPPRPIYEAIKRGFDVIVSAALLGIFAPLFFIVALLIKFTSPGPIFYRWRVVGKGGKPFIGYKFRTMVINADALKASLMTFNEMSGPVFKIKNDPRITPIGRVLRKLSVDELPQLWSVLRGDMSLVGPRPPLQTEYVQFEPWQRAKLGVTPGITCLWQIKGRNNVNDFDEWVRLDLEYIRRRSFLFDLWILIATVPAVIFGRGAA